MAIAMATLPPSTQLDAQRFIDSLKYDASTSGSDSSDSEEDDEYDIDALRSSVSSLVQSTQLGAQRVIDQLEDDDTSSSDSSDPEEDGKYEKPVSRSSPQAIQPPAQPIEVIVISSGEESSELEEEDDEEEVEPRSAACENDAPSSRHQQQNIAHDNKKTSIENAPDSPQHASSASDCSAVLAAAIKEEHEEFWVGFGQQVQKNKEERDMMRPMKRKRVEAVDEEENLHQRPRQRIAQDENFRVHEQPEETSSAIPDAVEDQVGPEPGESEEEMKVEDEEESQSDDSSESDSDEAGGDDAMEGVVNCRRLEQSELDKSKATLMAGQMSRVEVRTSAHSAEQSESGDDQETLAQTEKYLELEKRKTIARIQKSTIGTGVLEAGRAAQMRRGVQPRDRVLAGRITKLERSTKSAMKVTKDLAPKIELSGRQKLLNKRIEIISQEATTSSKPSNPVSQHSQLNGKTQKAKQSQRSRRNKVKKKRESSGSDRVEHSQPREAISKTKKQKKREKYRLNKYVKPKGLAA